MNIKNSSKLGNTKLLAIMGAAIVACTSLYAVSTAEAGESKKQTKIIKIIQDKDEKGDREIDIDKDGKQFIEKNGERYVMENDVKRPMTNEEEKEFDKEIATAHKHTKMAGAEVSAGEDDVKFIRKHMGGSGDHAAIMKKYIDVEGSGKKGGKQIRIIKKHMDGDSIDVDIDIEELVQMAEEMAAEEMRYAEIEIEKAHGATDRAQREIESAIEELASAHAANDISEKEMKVAKKELIKAQAELKKAQAELNKDRARVEKSAEKARKEAKRVRKELNKKD